MFYLSLIEHTLRLPPHLLHLPLDEAIKIELETLFLDKVIANLGLCISVYDTRSVKGGFIFPGDGASTYMMEFRLIVFRPFVGEIVVAKLKESDANGLHFQDKMSKSRTHFFPCTKEVCGWCIEHIFVRLFLINEFTRLQLELRQRNVQIIPFCHLDFLMTFTYLPIFYQVHLALNLILIIEIKADGYGTLGKWKKHSLENHDLLLMGQISYALLCRCKFPQTSDVYIYTHFRFS